MMVRLKDLHKKCKAGPGVRRRAEAGFTLLELTIAMVFVALLAGGIVITVSTALKVWSKVLQANEINQEARAIVELLSRDLRGAYLGRNQDTGVFAGGAPIEDFGGLTLVDTLELTTESSAAGNVALLPEEVRSEWNQEEQPPISDLALVRWEWREARADRPAGLYRVRAVATHLEAETELGIEEPRGGVSEELISSAVESLRLQYYDGENWMPSWDSREQDNRLPQAVAIELELAPEDREQTRTFETVVSIAIKQG